MVEEYVSLEQRITQQTEVVEQLDLRLKRLEYTSYVLQAATVGAGMALPFAYNLPVLGFLSAMVPVVNVVQKTYLQDVLLEYYTEDVTLNCLKNPQRISNRQFGIDDFDSVHFVQIPFTLGLAAMEYLGGVFLSSAVLKPFLQNL